MADLVRIFIGSLKLFFDREVVLSSVAVGLASGCVNYYIQRKDDKFTEAMFSGFQGELPSGKEIRIYCPSGECRHIDSEEFNYMMKNRK